jgi:hypothetical protein
MNRLKQPRQKVVFLPYGAARFLPRPPKGTVLGVVQRGLLTGALVQLDDGAYTQVNGDIVEPLNASSVEHALRAAGAAAKRPKRVRAPAPPATVVVKRRRMIEPSLTD